jgi:hypothetical protein
LETPTCIQFLRRRPHTFTLNGLKCPAFTSPLVFFSAWSSASLTGTAAQLVQQDPDAQQRREQHLEFGRLRQQQIEGRSGALAPEASHQRGGHRQR